MTIASSKISSYRYMTFKQFGVFYCRYRRKIYTISHLDHKVVWCIRRICRKGHIIESKILSRFIALEWENVRVCWWPNVCPQTGCVKFSMVGSKREVLLHNIKIYVMIISERVRRPFDNKEALAHFCS